MSADVIEKLDEGHCRKLIEDMVAIPSVVNDERDLAEYLRGELDALGLETSLQPVEGDRANVIGKLGFQKPGKTLMFNGHMDTVPVCEGWNTDPFKPIIRDGRLYGLGSMDMKAGIACALTTIKALIDADVQLKGTLLFTGVVDEEAYSKGAKALLKSEYGRTDATIIGEHWTGLPEWPVPLGITGKVLYELNVKGRSAHGFDPHLGINAIEDAARILVNLDKLKLKPHPRFGKGNFCTLKIEGGYKVYSVVVPDRCRVEINRLLVPGETVSSAVDDMRVLVKSLNLRAEVDVGTKPPRYESFEMSRDLPIVRVFSDAFKEVHGMEPEFQYSSSITDGNVFTGEGGIPSIHLGPEGEGAHQPNEYLVLDSLMPTMNIYAKMACRFLG